MEVNEVRGTDRIESNRIEWKRRCYRPTGGWAVRMKRIEYRTGTLGQTSGPSLSVMGLLESHAILGVMLCGLSIVQEEMKKKVDG